MLHNSKLQVNSPFLLYLCKSRMKKIEKLQILIIMKVSIITSVYTHTVLLNRSIH